MVLLRVLDRSNDSEWGNISYTLPKSKANRVSILSDFRNWNKKLKRKPYSITKTNGMLLKLECFQYATSLDLRQAGTEGRAY